MVVHSRTPVPNLILSPHSLYFILFIQRFTLSLTHSLFVPKSSCCKAVAFDPHGLHQHRAFRAFLVMDNSSFIGVSRANPVRELNPTTNDNVGPAIQCIRRESPRGIATFSFHLRSFDPSGGHNTNSWGL